MRADTVKQVRDDRNPRNCGRALRAYARACVICVSNARGGRPLPNGLRPLESMDPASGVPSMGLGVGPVAADASRPQGEP